MRVSAHERFYNRVSKTASCWIWIGCTDRAGYGRFNLNGKPVYAHRYSLSEVEDLIVDKEVDHLCRNKSCVRPEHLEQVDHMTNLKRSPIHFINKPFPLKKICKYGHKKEYSLKEKYLICKVCRRIRVRDFYRKKSLNRI